MSNNLSFEDWWSGERGFVDIDKLNISAADKTAMHLHRAVAKAAWEAALSQQAQRCEHGEYQAHTLGRSDIGPDGGDCPGPQQAQPNCAVCISGSLDDCDSRPGGAVCPRKQAQPEMPTPR